MQLVQFEKAQSKLVESFLQAYESSCVQLCSLVRKADCQIYIVCKNEKPDKVEDIFGVFSFDGSFHHCLPNLGKNQSELEEFESIFVDFLKKSDKSIKCINGIHSSTKILLDILEKQNLSPYQINRYELLILNKKAENAPQKLMNDDFVKVCTLNDFENLIELQKHYLIDEVAPKGKKVSDLEASVLLKQILKNQICVAIVSDEEFCAKANTNAISWNVVQIGGVYTNPLFRRNYYAWHLVSYLANLLIDKKKQVCLFVNEKNIPALNLYKKLGFEQIDKFEICYFS